jgi:hypothetical protein
MREALFIFVVVLVLLALTAIRYRKQITAVIRFSRMLRNAGATKPIGNAERRKDVVVPLAKCAKCGTWVPQTRAIKFGPGNYYCSSKCMEAAAIERY